MLQEYLSQFGDVSIEFTQIGKSYFQVPQALNEIVEKAREETEYAGLLLATEKQKNLIVSPNLLNLIAKQTTQKIKLDGKAAWLFICGRDIFVENVREKPQGKGPFIVENDEGEVLGVCKKIKKQNKALYKNILDIGIYNRREK